jgi:ketopantoate reductase
MPPHLERVYVIGMGEVGRRVAQALRTADSEVFEVTRDHGWEGALRASSAMRLVCVREEDLPAVLDRLRVVPDEWIVAVQNGWLRPPLIDLPNVTRGLIWFTSKGEFFEMLRPSPFHGPCAGVLAMALTQGGIHTIAVGESEFRGFDAEKMGFNCVVGLPLAVHGLSLEEYLYQQLQEARDLFNESVTTCARALGVAADPGWWDEFRRVAETLGWVRAAKPKALEFRNGAVARLAADQGVAVPVTNRLLTAARAD